MKESEYHFVSFRAGDVYFNRIGELADKLKVNRSECIRLMLDLGFKEYLDKKGPLLVVNDEKWNEMMEARVEDVKFNRFVEKGFKVFTENLAAFTTNPKATAAFQEFLKVVASKLKPKGASDKAIDIPESDISNWVDTALRGDHVFETKDVDPEVQQLKEMILQIVRKCKGKID